MLPGWQGGYPYDYPALLAALAKAGYAGRLSVEDHSGMFGACPAPRTAVFRAVREYVAGCLAMA